MNIGTGYQVGSNYCQVQADTKQAHNNGWTNFEIEINRLARDFGERLDILESMLANLDAHRVREGMIMVGSMTLSTTGKTVTRNGLTTTPQPFYFSEADVRQAKENIPGQIYTMLLEFKEKAEEGSLRMAAIEHYMNMLPSMYPEWSGKPIPLHEGNKFQLPQPEASDIVTVRPENDDTPFTKAMKSNRNQTIHQIRFSQLNMLDIRSLHSDENRLGLQPPYKQAIKQTITQYEKMLSKP